MKFKSFFAQKPVRSLFLLVALLSVSILYHQASPAEASTASSLQIWWPADGAHMQGTQPFKGMLENYSLSQYSLYWQVDGGSLNAMPDNYTDYPHKEYLVNLSGWNWRGTGPYTLTFTAKNSQGQIITSVNRTIYVDTPVSTPALVTKLYVDPNSNAKKAGLDKIGNNSQAIWLGGWYSTTDLMSKIQSTLTAAATQASAPVFVAYNIPQRDCGSFSAGGSNTSDGYKLWIQTIASAIGDKNAIVVLEPDALAQIGCLSQADQSTRLNLLSYAVTALKAKKGVAVYIDAGHSAWIDAATMAARLAKANVAAADGFSLNVSNFQTTANNVVYGTAVSSKIDNKHFVIDTSRNGNGSNGEWCNPSNRALGEKPTLTTGIPLVDGYLWIKNPGESDGSCNGGPSAGNWWLQYGQGLASLAHW
jgi:hypothetical protein